MTRAASLPLFVVIVVFALFGPSQPAAAVLALLALFPMVIRWRWRTSAFGELATLVVVGGLAVAVFSTAFSRHLSELGAVPANFVATVLLVATLRGFFAAPLGGPSFGFVLGLLALMGCASRELGVAYPAAVAAFLVAALVARRRSSPTRTPIVALLKEHALALFAMASVTVGLAYGLASALPSAHEWAMARITKSRFPSTGVGDRLWLGSLRGVLESSEPVLRLRGRRVALLRGVVFDRYDAGRFSHGEATFETRTTETSLAGEGLTEIDNLEAEPRHYFVPAEASTIALSSGLARVDALGNLEPVEAHPASRIQAALGNSRAIRVAEPRPLDVRVPDGLLAQLRERAFAYVGGLEDPRARLDALERGLRRDHPYSLEFERSPFGDPVLEFLNGFGGGHCEYFAASLALLARALGIPARVVVGYRVVESNPLSGDAIVRERDAHAWVEAWVDGQWSTWDPTPSGEASLPGGRTTPVGLAVLDVLGRTWSRFLIWLDARTLSEALAAPVIAVFLGLVVRWLRKRRETFAPKAVNAFAPLPCFTRLAAELAEHGLEVRPFETLEALAARAASTDALGTSRAPCARALERYAALRYGDVGDEKAISDEVDALVRALKTRR